MALFHQIFAVCRWNFRGLTNRAKSAVVVVASFFAVILVFTTVLTIRDGIAVSGARPNADGIAVIEHPRGLDPTMLNAVRQIPGVAHDGRDVLATGTLFTAMLLRDWKPGMIGIAVIMGIPAQKTAILPNFRLTAGRMFDPGQNEMIAGAGAAKIFPQYALGRTLEWQHRKWKIVGTFTTESDVQDSLFLADLLQVQTARGGGATYFTSIMARLNSPQDFDRFKTAVEKGGTAGANVRRLSERDTEMEGPFTGVLTLADGVITTLMAFGAIFAALNVMYAAVDARKSELAIFRALGFQRLPILTAILSEAMALALIGGLLAIATVAICFGGLQTSTMIGNRLVSFRFALTGSAVAAALVLTLAMGFVGGLFPAIRAARRPIAAALHEE